MKVKKWIPILLALLLAVSQIAGASAEAATEAEAFTTIQAALEAGREAAYSAKINWASPSLLDDETNAALKALFESLSVSGRFGTLEEKSYSSTAASLGGTDIFNFDVIAYEDGTSFLSSPLYGGMLSLDPEDLPQYYENLFALMENTQGFEGVDTVMLRSFVSGFMMGVQSSQGMLTLEDGEELSPNLFVGDMGFDVEGLTEAVNGVLEAALVVEQVEGNVESAAGIECARADVYTLDKDEMFALVEVIANNLAQNEPPVELILSLSGMTEADLVAQGMTVEEFSQGLQEAFLMLPVLAQSIPEDSIFSVYNCFDEQDEPVLNIIRADFPGIPAEGSTETPASLLDLEIEWTPDCSFFYLYGASEGDGFEFLVVDSPAEVVEQEGVVETNDLLHINFTAMEGEIPLFQLGLDVYGQKTESEDAISTQNRIVAGYYTEEDSGALGITVAQEQTNDGQDVLINGEIGCTLLFSDGAALPLASLKYSVETREPEALPFDETAADIAYPGKMTEEEFAEWFNNSMIPSIMKTGLFAMSQLPDELVSMMVVTE